MSHLVPVKEYASAAEMMAAYAARKRPAQPIVVDVWTPPPPPPVTPLETLNPEAPPPPPPRNYSAANAILAEVCAQHGVKRSDVCGDFRFKELVAARRAAAARLCAETSLSLVEIGKLLGKDHTSILMAVRRHNEITGENIRNVGVVPAAVQERLAVFKARKANSRRIRTHAEKLRRSERGRLAAEKRKTL